MKVDVLIIGAGPTGLFMAEEVHRHGLSCKIIDKATSFSLDESRAAAIQPRTLEILEQIGLIDPFLEKGLKIRAVSSIFHFKPLTKISFQSLHSPYPFILSLQQAKTEEILKNNLSSLGIKIQTGVECIDITQTKESVFVTLKSENTGAKEKVEACYLIGCDGAHSFVRKKLGISFTGKTFDSVFSLADVCIQWPHSHQEVVVFLSKTSVLAAIPLPEKDRYRLIFQLPRCQNDPNASPPTFEEVKVFLEKHAGKNIKTFDPKWISNFSVNARLTSSYRQGRVFLAGDAAHIHSPIGGQGMNTGLQDAFNLAWKLALVHKGKAKSSLLDTYHIERHSVAKKVLQGTNRASFFATLQNPIGIFFRNHLISYLGKCSFFQKLLPKLLSQIAIHYPQNPSIFGSKAGKRAPDFPVKFQGKITTLYTLLAKKTDFLVLILAKDQGLRALSLAKDIHTKFLLEPIIICRSSLPETQGVILCEDSQEILSKIYQTITPCIYVIRPDGYIGYFGTLSQKQQIIFYLTSWLKESNSKL